MQLSSIFNILEQSVWACTPQHAETLRTLANLALGGDLPRTPETTIGSYEPVGIGAYHPTDLSTGSSDNTVVMLDNGIAIVPLRGTIAPKMNMMQAASGGISAEMTAQVFKALAADDRVKQVILDVDSPGGSVNGLEEARLALIELRDKKPVKAVANAMIASAATYITTAAHDTYVRPSSITGSIGTLAVFASESRRLEEDGIDVTIVRSGKFKAVPHSSEPLSETGLELLQQDVEKFTNAFYNALSENLGISMKDAKKMAGEGRIHDGNEGIEAGVASLEGDLATAVEDASNEISLEQEVEDLSDDLITAAATLVTRDARIAVLEGTLTEMAGELAALTLTTVNNEISALVEEAVADFRVTPDQLDDYVELGSTGGVDSLKTILSLLQPAPELSKADVSLNDSTAASGVPEEFANDKYFPTTEALKAQYRKSPMLRQIYGKYL